MTTESRAPLATVAGRRDPLFQPFFVCNTLVTEPTASENFHDKYWCLKACFLGISANKNKKELSHKNRFA
jgi:hypothetical protein